MKAELSIPPEFINAVAEAVVERLRPMKSRSAVIAAVTGDLLGGVGPISRDEAQQDRQRALPREGYLRLKEVLALIPVSKSTWYKGVADGRYPKPTKKFGPRIAAWEVGDIRSLLERSVD